MDPTVLIYMRAASEAVELLQKIVDIYGTDELDADDIAKLEALKQQKDSEWASLAPQTQPGGT